MSDSPLQRMSVPNKLHLNLHAGVLVPAPFKCLHVMTVVGSFVRHGTANATLLSRFYVLCKIASFSPVKDTLRVGNVRCM